MTEQQDAEGMRELMRDWASRWATVDPLIDYGATSISIRRQILAARKRILHFSEYEGPYLPSRVLFRRMWEMDDTLLRLIYQILPKGERATLDAEAKASMEKHGSVEEAHRARLLRDRFGIPRL
jgi:hypothetical protein